MQVGYPDLVRKPPSQHAEDETNNEVAREAAPQAFDTTGQNAHAVPLTQSTRRPIMGIPGRTRLGHTGLPCECTTADARPHITERDG